LSTIAQTKRHHRACLEYARLEHKHLQELSEQINRGTSIKLWMHRNYPGCGVAFWTGKPEAVIMKPDHIRYRRHGVFVAGDPIYSMIPLFPKLALYGAGRARVEITDTTEYEGVPSYRIARCD